LNNVDKDIALFEFSEGLQSLVSMKVIEDKDVRDQAEEIVSLNESLQLEIFEELIGAFIAMLPAASLCEINLFNTLFGTCAKIIDSQEILDKLEIYNEQAIQQSVDRLHEQSENRDSDDSD
jgi:hypothetical protein